MVRRVLAAQDGERNVYHGTFEQFGVAANRFGTKPTLVLVNVMDAHGAPVCDHLWFSLTKAFAALDLFPGDVVEFAGRVTAYRKRGGTDYRLSWSTQVRKVRDAKVDAQARLLP